MGFLYFSRKLLEQLLAVSENRGICTKVGLAAPLGTLVVTYWGFSVLLTPSAAARQLGSLDRWSTVAALIILNEIAPKRQHSSCCPLQGDSPHKEHGGQVKVQITKGPAWPLHRIGVAGKMGSTQGTCVTLLPLATLLSLHCYGQHTGLLPNFMQQHHTSQLAGFLCLRNKSNNNPHPLPGGNKNNPKSPHNNR